LPALTENEKPEKPEEPEEPRSGVFAGWYRVAATYNVSGSATEIFIYGLNRLIQIDASGHLAMFGVVDKGYFYPDRVVDVSRPRPVPAVPAGDPCSTGACTRFIKRDGNTETYKIESMFHYSRTDGLLYEHANGEFLDPQRKFSKWRASIIWVKNRDG
jgi:hypothetical protein